jgi:biopolymer transport protein ExbB
MNLFAEIFTAFKLGGFVMLPLLLLCILATALIIDKILFYKKFVNLPQSLLALIETYDFNWNELSKKLEELPQKNSYRKFFSVILQNKKKPTWWLESRAADEGKLTEKELAKGLWILETIITAAPLLGLLGTIVGMMESFKLIGDGALLNPSGVTGGVAQALIATAFGLFIAIFSLFAFNYFSRKQDQVLDEIERLGSRVIDHIKLDQKDEN